MLQINQVTKTMFGNLLFNDVTEQINDGQKIALVGANGSGKSTLLKIIAGIEGVDSGSISISKNQQISYLEQHSIVTAEETVYDYIYNGQKEIKEMAIQLTTLEKRLSDPEETNFEKIMNRYGEIQEKFMEKDGYVIEEMIKSIATGLRIESLLYHGISELSGGQQTLAKLARCLLENNEILLLDEPTNHLDEEGLNWLENHLKYCKQTVIIVSHDRYFLDKVADCVLLIDQKKITNYIGNYTKFKELRELELIEQQKNYLIQQKEIKQTEEAIRRFRHWGAISDDEKHFKKAKRLESQLEKMDKVDSPQKTNNISSSQGFKERRRSGKEVIQLVGVSKSFEEKVVLRNINMIVYRQDRLVITGVNGSGKSTLIKSIIGAEKISSGEIKRGNSVEIGYLSQVILYNEENQTVLDYFKNHVEVFEEDARRILSYFKFFKDDVFKKVVNLSGGEKVRLELACLMNQPINCLILDEPTNHLDIETREWLEEQLISFNGTLILVSHDRYFVQKLSNREFKIEKMEAKK
ncbi:MULTISPECIES: ribosomal protection-like ABC-F family protein [Vagococcus]|uniref:ABC transporter, ATP-binding protein n=1 Tax=Vagococcus fluvialis bH819 TaxID=1255619 RepID=A0A1X6WNZ7_9ENTE|nr:MULTISPECIES: ABC-F family ATP-binding cassette domain-containing protein [Vagococcus]SLM85952.1 ABC transporter, ATP-binding protein [Vagococcus fluvialis bH819]HCM88319.1 ABC transporter ATP-binding protein [Vagococcus sp.]